MTTIKVLLISLSAVMACSATAYAEGNTDKKPADKKAKKEKKAKKAKMLELYDTDKDGKLNAKEKKKMKKAQKNEGRCKKKDKATE